MCGGLPKTINFFSGEGAPLSHSFLVSDEVASAFPDLVQAFKRFSHGSIFKLFQFNEIFMILFF